MFTSGPVNHAGQIDRSTGEQVQNIHNAITHNLSKLRIHTPRAK